MHESLWVIHWYHEDWLFVQNNNRYTIDVVFDGIRINNSNYINNAKNTIVSSIEKNIKENSIWCRILNDTKQNILMVCVCLRTKTKRNNSMVMTTWSWLLFCKFGIHVCIWFFFLTRINDSRQLAYQQHLVDVDATRICLEFLSLF